MLRSFATYTTIDLGTTSGPFTRRSRESSGNFDRDLSESAEGCTIDARFSHDLTHDSPAFLP